MIEKNHQEVSVFGKQMNSYFMENHLAARFEESPMHLAARNGHRAIYCLLNYFSQEKNPRNGDGQTPLDVAAKHGCLDICRLIMQSTLLMDSKTIDTL